MSALDNVAIRAPASSEDPGYAGSPALDLNSTPVGGAASGGVPAPGDPVGMAGPAAVPGPVLPPNGLAGATPHTPALNGIGTPPSASSLVGNPSSLYVGDLDSGVTEALLFQVFSMIGTVQSIRVCRDAHTRRSLGYAYVNFNEAADAEKAIEALNYSAIRGRPCRIMFSQRDPSLRRTGAGNIFIKNLDESIDHKALHDTFSAFGKILSCKVATGPDGRSLGYGFVHYDTTDGATQAIFHVNGMLLNDKKVFVGHHVPKKERMARAEAFKARFTNVYIKNIVPEISDDEFEALFARFGTITSWHLAKDTSGKLLGFGFVNFSSHDEAQAAVDVLNGSEYRGLILFVGRAQKKNERMAELANKHQAHSQMTMMQGNNLYLKNIPESWDDQQLYDLFGVFGPITSAKVMRDPTTGLSRMFGFVCFTTPDQANQAIAEMNDKLADGRPLYVAHAQAKDVRRQQLEVLMMQRQQLRQQQQQQQQISYGAARMYGYPYGGQMDPGPRSHYSALSGMMSPTLTMAYQPMIGPFQGAMSALQQQSYGERPPRSPAPRAAPHGPWAGAAPWGPLGSARSGSVLRASGVPAVNPVVPVDMAGGSAPPKSAPAVSVGGLDLRLLAEVSSAEQKQMLGEAIFPQIAETQPDLAGKLTGMLLEMQISELLILADNRDALNAKINEGLAVLREHAQHEADTGMALPVPEGIVA